MRGILKILIVVGLILLPVVLIGGDRVSLVGERNVVVGEGSGGRVIGLFNGDSEGSGVHNQQPHDGPPLQEAWPYGDWYKGPHSYQPHDGPPLSQAHPFSDEWLKCVIPDFPESFIIFNLWLTGSTFDCLLSTFRQAFNHKDTHFNK
jgi:hypothetical protein